MQKLTQAGDSAESETRSGGGGLEAKFGSVLGRQLDRLQEVDSGSLSGQQPDLGREEQGKAPAAFEGVFRIPSRDELDVGGRFSEYEHF